MNVVLPKLGRRPATPPRVRSLRHLFGLTPRPMIPQSTNRIPLVPNYGMDGNDQWGCCVEAAACHAVDLWTASAGDPRMGTTEDALRMYAGFGFDPNAGPSGANPTDTGTNVQDMLQRWMTTGYMIGGKLDKIDGFASISPTDLLEVKEGIAWEGCVIMGLSLPNAYQTMLDPSVPFDIPDGQSLSGDWAPNPNLGHCILGGDFDPVMLKTITWGAPKDMTPRFWMAYGVECYVALSRDFSSAAIPEELWTTLEADMRALEAQGAVAAK